MLWNRKGNDSMELSMEMGGLIKNDFVVNVKDMLVKPMRIIFDVGIELTNDCNMSCPYCWRKDRKIGYMDMELFKKIIKQIPFYARVGLSYAGESILHPRFKEIVDMCQGKFRDLVTYSNGILPYPPGIRVIKYPKPPQFIVTKDFKIAEGSRAPERVSSYCKQLFKYIAILWNGDVTLCCSDLTGSKVIGNVSDRSIKDIWRSEEYEKLRAVGHCEGCEIYQYRRE
jgi:MoaA/NifB/PqqE/SkfB family radical SAM enzyme